MARSTAPEISGYHIKRVTEDGHQATTGGDLDVKNGPDLFRAFTSLEGTYGTFSMDSHGVWTYTLDNTRAATQDLAPRGPLTYDWFTAETADGTLSQAVVVIVRGSADAAPAPTVELGIVGVSDFGA